MGDLLSMLHSILLKIFEFLLMQGIDLPEPSVLIDPLIVEEEIDFIEEHYQQFVNLIAVLL